MKGFMNENKIEMHWGVDPFICLLLLLLYQRCLYSCLRLPYTLKLYTELKLFDIKKYRRAEYVQRHVPSSNVQVLFIFQVVLIDEVHLNI